MHTGPLLEDEYLHAWSVPSEGAPEREPSNFAPRLAIRKGIFIENLLCSGNPVRRDSNDPSTR